MLINVKVASGKYLLSKITFNIPLLGFGYISKSVPLISEIFVVKTCITFDELEIHPLESVTITKSGLLRQIKDTCSSYHYNTIDFRKCSMILMCRYFEK